MMLFHSGSTIKCSPGEQEVMDSIPSWLILKTLKMVLGAINPITIGLDDSD